MAAEDATASVVAETVRAIEAQLEALASTQHGEPTWALQQPEEVDDFERTVPPPSRSSGGSPFHKDSMAAITAQLLASQEQCRHLAGDKHRLSELLKTANRFLPPQRRPTAGQKAVEDALRAMEADVAARASSAAVARAQGRVTTNRRPLEQLAASNDECRAQVGNLKVILASSVQENARLEASLREDARQHERHVNDLQERVYLLRDGHGIASRHPVPGLLMSTPSHGGGGGAPLPASISSEHSTRMSFHTTTASSSASASSYTAESKAGTASPKLALRLLASTSNTENNEGAAQEQVRRLQEELDRVQAQYRKLYEYASSNRPF